MSVDVVCTNPKCAGVILASERLVGRSVKCPHCGHVVSVPSLQPPQNPDPPARPEQSTGKKRAAARKDHGRRVEKGERVLKDIKTAGRALEIAASAIAVLQLIGLLFFCAGLAQARPGQEELVAVLLVVQLSAFLLGWLYTGLIVAGAHRMAKLSSYRWSMFAAILAIFGIVLTPFGIWALLVLRRSATQERFRKERTFLRLHSTGE